MRFEEFYKAYPKKVARKDAEKAWSRLTPAEQEQAMEALPNHVRYWSANGTPKEYMPHAATWLNGARYEDEIEMPKPPEQAVAWWASEAGILSKGRELGIHARGGESMNEFKARVVEAARRAA